MSLTIDRPAAIRRALRDLVAERGLHGASMSAVARHAGVATGTAYVHYASKTELVIATYLEVKAELAHAVLAEFNSSETPLEQYRHIVAATHRHMSAAPERARFLAQIDVSPHRLEAHARLVREGDRLLTALEPLMKKHLIALPVDVLWSMSLGLVVQLVAAGVELSEADLATLTDVTWRAISQAA